MKSSFGALADGTAVDLYTLNNAKGIEMRGHQLRRHHRVAEGADKNGAPGDVVLGYNAIDDYVKDTPYFGAIVGRYGNRIGGARFTLDGKTYTLASQRRRQHAARRPQGLRQAGVDGEAGREGR